MAINGTEISKEILEQVAALHTDPITLRIISVTSSPVTSSYLRIKQRAAERAGITVDLIELPEAVTTEEVITEILKSGADAVVVQLPLPSSLNEQEILNAIPQEKDADVLSEKARECETLLAPVASAVQEVLTRGCVEVRGKKAVVIGKGRLVGEPVELLFKRLGADVISYDKDTFTPEVLIDADIVVSGAGVPHLVKPEMVQDGVVLIDAGSSEQEGSVVGDIDPACEAKASVFTPVPGGIGPIAVACLMRNIAQLQMADIQVH